MKAEELSIGLLVYVGHCHSNICGDYDVEFVPEKLTLEHFKFWAENHWDKNDFNEFLEPIPLTAEILEKNKWCLCDDCEYVSPFDIDFRTGLRLFGFGEYYDKSGFGVNVGCVQLRKDLKYVHELQNLLSSLGLHELAENFVV